MGSEHGGKAYIEPGNTNQRGRLRTVDLVKVASLKKMLFSI